jgi:eukaryotic-like serine/threonine-protein kinase
LRYKPTCSHDGMNRCPEPTCPIGGVSWFDAAMYCNWLSKQEGIDENQWCYDMKGQVPLLKENYLGLTGYRLPTEAEMEYATRAGSLTSRYFGESDELLRKYAWYFKNSQDLTWPVGSLKPNDLGLSDVLGNVGTWCQENYKEYPQGQGVSEDKEDALPKGNYRVLRGGSFVGQASNLRSSLRYVNVSTSRNASVGFRLARTFMP